MRPSSKTQEQIKALLKADVTYKEIGNKFGFCERKIASLAKEYGLTKASRRWSRLTPIQEGVIADFNSGLSVKRILKKYKIDLITLNLLVRASTGKTLRQAELNERNLKLSEKYLNGSTAKSLIISNNRDLSNPNKIRSMARIYEINKELGVKKYPSIGDRSAGGSSDTKQVLRIIKTKRDAGLSFNEIATLLNTKNLRTQSGVPFTYHNVRFKYLALIKNSN